MEFVKGERTTYVRNGLMIKEKIFDDWWKEEKPNRLLDERWCGQTVFYEETPLWYVDKMGVAFSSIVEAD